MARPIKKGIEYFPFDVGFFSDQKIRILKARYGADGITFYIYLLTEIYKEGYFLAWTDDAEYIAADELGMSVEKVKQVMKFLLERSLFSDTLFQSDTILTSAGIQKRYQEAVETRARKTPINIDKYWVLDRENTKPWLKVAQFADYSENNPRNVENNPPNLVEEVHKVKESKVKESKVKEKKGEERKKERDISAQENKKFVADVLSHLNSQTGSNYRASTAETIGMIVARKKEGYTMEQFKSVIDKKTAEWKGTEFEKYLRPNTLFRPGNFESYVNQKINKGKKQSKDTTAGNYEQREYSDEFLEQFYEYAFDEKEAGKNEIP